MPQTLGQTSTTLSTVALAISQASEKLHSRCHQGLSSSCPCIYIISSITLLALILTTDGMLLLTALSLTALATLQPWVRSEIIGFSDEQDEIQPLNLCVWRTTIWEGNQYPIWFFFFHLYLLSPWTFYWDHQLTSQRQMSNKDTIFCCCNRGTHFSLRGSSENSRCFFQISQLSKPTNLILTKDFVKYICLLLQQQNVIVSSAEISPEFHIGTLLKGTILRPFLSFHSPCLTRRMPLESNIMGSLQ